jgi:hypothetical protein
VTSYAFPGIAEVNGELMIVYRDGPQHNIDTGVTRGIIYRETSTDNGATWGTKTAVVDDTVNEFDARTGTIHVLSSDTVIVPYTLGESGVGPVQTAWVARSVNNGSSWSQIQITNSFTDWQEIGGFACEAANGDILIAMSGEDTGDTEPSVRVSKSSDDAQTWSHLADIADGPGDARDYYEPALIRLPNDDILCIMRTTLDVFYKSLSTDDGATWSSPTSMVFPATGRPSPLVLSDGTIVLWHRDVGHIGWGVLRYSYDNGVTWTSPQLMQVASLQSVYAQLVEITPNDIGIAYANETNSTTAEVRFAWMRRR